MRIVGYIDHPTLKVTLFKMNNKLSVKFEHGPCEQIYKFREGETVEGVNDLRQLIDEAFIAGVEKELRRMETLRGEAMGRLKREEEKDEFDDII